MRTIKRQVALGARQEQVYTRLKNLSEVTRSLPQVDLHQLEESTTRWRLEIDGLPLEWVQRDDFHDADCRLDFRSTEGDFDQFEGSWVVARDGARTTINFELRFSLDLPIGGNEINKKIEGCLSETVDELLDALQSTDASR